MSEKKKTKKKAKKTVQLEWRDYVALTIALLQTTLLPFVLLIFVLLALVFFVSILIAF